MRRARIKKILITAGPTREMLDPVRFISNLSTGEMGYAIARAARRRYQKVTLISGPTALQPPPKVKFIPVTSAREMQLACQEQISKHNVLIMTAAVADFTATKQRPQKIRRTSTRRLLLKQTPDILAGLAKEKGNKVFIGFCLETQDWLKNAREKLVRKQLDGIVANYYTKDHVPFGDRRITTAFLDSRGKIKRLVRYSKPRIATKLLKWIARF